MENFVSKSRKRLVMVRAGNITTLQTVSWTVSSNRF